MRDPRRGCCVPNEDERTMTEERVEYRADTMAGIHAAHARGVGTRARAAAVGEVPVGAVVV